MSVFAIGDLHLSLGSDKSMEVFGGWKNYVELIKENWCDTVKDDDTVVIVGDLSWGMTLEESLNDFEFLNALPGNKVILKGNHDYWWGTVNKINRFFAEKGLSTLKILHNNCYEVGNVAICGTRGWILEEKADFTTADKKIALREEGRLRLSLQAAKDGKKDPVVFLHYPPIFGVGRAEGIIDIMKEFSVKRCFYGHLHAASSAKAFEGLIDGIDYKLVSADYLRFKPHKVI